MRLLPAALALLLVAAGIGAGAAVGSDAPAVPVRPAESTATAPGTAPGTVVSGANAARTTATRNASSHDATNGTAVFRVLSLPPDGDTASGIDTVRIDVGTAVTFGTNASLARMRTAALRERIVAVEGDERQVRILNALNDVTIAIIALHSRQQAAFESYAAGELSGRELLVELARIDARAAVLRERVRLLDRLAEGTEDFSLDDSRVFPLVYDLNTFGGPVRQRVLAALKGQTSEPLRVYVAADGAGVELATVTDDAYVREVYRGDLRDRDGTNVNEERAQNVTARSYPEIWAARADTVSGQGSGGTFIFTVPYPNGTLTAFVGGGTERVFKEYQRVELDAYPSGETVSGTLDLTVRVNRTFPGGALRVAVVDPDTGEPVDAVVKIGRDGGATVEVGRTGGDGVLWTVSPRGEFVVTAVEPGSNDVGIVDVTAADPHTVAEAFDEKGNETAG